ncbi:secreted protein [Cryptosporidium felis]|nr:secreted protein [Cryptosporidium felis]
MSCSKLLLLSTIYIFFQRVSSSDIILESRYEDLIEPDEPVKLDKIQFGIESDIAVPQDLQNRSLHQSSGVQPTNTSNSPDSWEEIEKALNTTTVETPYPPFNKTSTGACVKYASDVRIIFGAFRTEFQNVVAKCSRKALGSQKNTFRCLEKHSFDGLFLSEECNNCWAKTAHCGVKHCTSQCLFRTCSTKCQKCSTTECSELLNECAGTAWMPLPCGLDPHSPIPENFRISDPK